MRGRQRVAGVLLLALFVIPLSSVDAASNCPGPYCSAYKITCANIDECRWPASSNGIVRIPYWVNPDQLWMSEAEAVGAVKAAARAWETYNPRIRFIYKGTTDDLPIPLDGKFVVGWMLGTPGAGMAIGQPPQDDHLVSLNDRHQADVWMNASQSWRWVPCHTDCKAVPRKWCTTCAPGVPDYTNDGHGGTAVADVQPTLTHEFGHVLGLDHPGGDETAGLTMVSGVASYEQPGPEYESRERSTLGLGDVLGLKKLYPWTCPKLKPGQSYPSAYRYLCPSIRIFSP